MKNIKENYQLEIIVPAKARKEFIFQEFVDLINGYLRILQQINPVFKKLSGVTSKILLNEDLSNLPQLLESEAVDNETAYFDKNKPNSQDFSYNASSGFGYDASFKQNNGEDDLSSLAIRFSFGWDDGGGSITINFPFGAYNDEHFYKLSFIKELIIKSIHYWKPFSICLKNHEIDDMLNQIDDDIVYYDFSWLIYLNNKKIWEYLSKEVQQKSELLSDGVLISFADEFPDEISKDLEKVMKELQRVLMKRKYLDYPYQ